MIISRKYVPDMGSGKSIMPDPGFAALLFKLLTEDSRVENMLI
jgi:hypothetical protein